ncbi:hypothetical protein BZG36_05430, partial [Bifiguratus adelaidae]
DWSRNPRLYVAGKVYQFWLDPTEDNPTRIVIEKTTAADVCAEIIVRRNVLLDHLPSNYDVAFNRAREYLMLNQVGDIVVNAKDIQDQGASVLDNANSTGQASVWNQVLQKGLEHGTKRNEV